MRGAGGGGGGSSSAQIQLLRARQTCIHIYTLAYIHLYILRNTHTHKHSQPAARGQNVLLRRRTAGRFILCVCLCMRPALASTQLRLYVRECERAYSCCSGVCGGERERAVWCDAVRMAAWRCAERGRGRRRRIAVRDKNKKKQEILQPAHPLPLFPTQLHSKV